MNEPGKICICEDCGKPFKSYKFSEDCNNCDDGLEEVEMEGEYEPSLRSCRICGGSGSIVYVINRRCRPCHEHIIYEEENDY